MISAEPELMNTLQQSHKVATKAVVVANQKDPIFELSVIDGNVRNDSTQKFRRTADAKLSDPTGSLVPRDLTDLLHPLSGNEVFLYRGAYVPELGRDSLCQVGAYRIVGSEITDSGSDLAITIKLADRGYRVSRSRVTQPLTYSSGSLLWSVLEDLLTLRYPDIEFGVDFSTVRPTLTVPDSVIDRTDDPWEMAVKWARAAGLDLYFDHQGMVFLDALEQGDPKIDDVVWNFDEGALSTVLSTRRNLTADDTYNHVVCYSQPTDGTTPVWGEAFISDTDHPLNIYGPMGDIPFFFSSNMFRDSAQCVMTAQALLYSHLGHTEHVHFNALVNPCLHDGDVVSVTRERSEILGYFSLDNLTIPLTAKRAMECDTRERFILA
jgi:hypothetical protein